MNNFTDKNSHTDSLSYDERRVAAINIDRLMSIALPENNEEMDIERDLKDNGELYKTSMRIAMKVKRALRLAGWSQASLAKKMNMDPAVLSKCLNGKANLELKTIIRFENVLGINIIDRTVSKPLKNKVVLMPMYASRRNFEIPSNFKDNNLKIQSAYNKTISPNINFSSIKD